MPRSGMGPTLQDRFTGCLLGLAVGDALGAPVEFMTHEAVQRHFGELRDMVGGGWLNLKPGQVTDDTEMMMCLAESLAATAEFNPADVARRFLAWYQQGPRDIGHTTAQALERLSADTAWDHASQQTHHILKGQTASNGALMRCAPLGLFHYARLERLIPDTVDSGRITHYDPRATHAAAALNLVISGCLRSLSVSQALKDARDTIRPHQEKVAQSIDLALSQPYDRPEVSGLALDTLQAACRCFFVTATFEDALVVAVNLGGDTDTVGAVCGAMAGACYGRGSIPRRWLEPLEHREHVVQLALALYRLSGAEAEELRHQQV